MKKILIALLFFPLMGFGQDAPFKGANTLVVNSVVTFEEVGKKLLKDGYSISYSDASLGFITTAWKDARWIKYNLNVAIFDDRIQIQAKAINEGANAVLNSTGSDWLVDYKKSGVENDIWKAMEVFASHFGTDRIYLQK